MPTLNGDRQQITMLPPCIEDYVGSQDRVRLYDAFIETLVKQQHIQLPQSSDMGRPEYDSKTMLKLLVYSYSYGVRSSRQIEKACHHNLSYIWLTGNLRPDHKTIARFRQEHLELLKNLLKQCVKLCIQLNVIDGHVLFVDGTKIRANASVKNNWDEARCQKILAHLDERIASLLTECQTLDQAEQAQSSAVQLPEDLKDAQVLRQKVEQILKDIKDQDSNHVNTVDPDCAVMHSAQGTHAAYNVQHVVDGQNGLIVSSEPVKDTNDSRQFSTQVSKAQDNLEQSCQVACADAGYANTKELENVEQQGVKVIVPSQNQALHEGSGPFQHDNFKYDEQTDSYSCPAGQTLFNSGSQKSGVSVAYRLRSGKICRACTNWGVCTQSSRGRTIGRMLNEAARKHFEAVYESPQGQEIFRQRKEKAEHPFGFIKRTLKADGFLLRGRNGAGAESSLWAVCFNLTRLATIFGGVSATIQQLRS
jgi:transposase